MRRWPWRWSRRVDVALGARCFDGDWMRGGWWSWISARKCGGGGEVKGVAPFVSVTPFSRSDLLHDPPCLLPLLASDSPSSPPSKSRSPSCFFSSSAALLSSFLHPPPPPLPPPLSPLSLSLLRLSHTCPLVGRGELLAGVVGMEQCRVSLKQRRVAPDPSSARSTAPPPVLNSSSPNTHW